MSWYEPVPAYSHPSLPSTHCSLIPRTQLKFCHVSNMSCSNALSVESGPNPSASLQVLPSVVLSHTLNRRKTQQFLTLGLYLPGLLSGMSDHIVTWTSLGWSPDMSNSACPKQSSSFSTPFLSSLIFFQVPIFNLFLSSSYTVFFQTFFFHSTPWCTPSPTFFLIDSHLSVRSQLRCCFL